MAVHLLLLPIFPDLKTFDPVIRVQQHALFFCENLDPVDLALYNLPPGVLVFLVDINDVHEAEHVSSVQGTFSFVPSDAGIYNFLGVLQRG